MTEGEKQNRKSESFFSSVIWSRITDLESAENWYDDPQYKPLMELRKNAGNTDFYIFEGV